MAIIKGMGIDIVEISRIAKAIARHGDKFTGKVFTPAEIVLCAQPNETRAAAAFAGRWAVKEAFYKALPPDIQPYSSWKSVQTLTDAAGKPYIDVCDEQLRMLLRDNYIHVSISHERTHCVAMVILE